MTEHTKFSLAGIFDLRGQAFDSIKAHTAAVDGLAAALADVDLALQTVIAEKNIDDQQALVTTARRLAELMDRGRA